MENSHVRQGGREAGREGVASHCTTTACKVIIFLFTYIVNIVVMNVFIVYFVCVGVDYE